MTIKRLKKLWMIAYLSVSNSGKKKAQFLKNHCNLKRFGENNFWYSRIVPADPERLAIGNNVKIATEVYFCTHDVLHDMFNDDPTLVSMGGGGIRDTQMILKFLITCLLEHVRPLCMV